MRMDLETRQRRPCRLKRLESRSGIRHVKGSEPEFGVIVMAIWKAI